MNQAPSPAAFQTTSWSEVATASQGTDPPCLAALERLLRSCAPPMVVHLMTKFRLTEDDAGEAVQGFIVERVLQNRILAKADRTRGRFRTFILNALDNYYLNQVRDARARRRFPSGGLVSIDAVADFDPPDSSDHPSIEFDGAWAVEVMREAAGRMERECAQSGRRDIWTLFQGRLLGPLLEDAPPTEFSALVEIIGIESSTKAAFLLTTGKRMFLRMLKAVVKGYVEATTDVDEEIEDLKIILSSARAWERSKPGKCI